MYLFQGPGYLDSSHFGTGTQMSLLLDLNPSTFHSLPCMEWTSLKPDEGSKKTMNG